MGYGNVREFNTKNMTGFNEMATDAEGVKYYSFGSKRHEKGINELLRPGYEIITEDNIRYECDGMIETNECRWGKYLVTFDQDHFEVMGFNPQVKPNHVAALVADNMRLCEIEQNAEDRYGIHEKKIAKAQYQKKRD